MKCKDFECCHKGFFKSKPDSYVCIGVPEPFIIDDINAECTEYPEKNELLTRKDLVEALRKGSYITDAKGNKLVNLNPVNHITLQAADEIEALESELKEIRMNYAILSDRYLAIRDTLRDKDWNAYWD